MFLLRQHDDDIVCQWQPEHQDDITSLSVYRENVMASSSYNGDIFIWAVSSGRVMCVLNNSVNDGQRLSPTNVFGL